MVMKLASKNTLVPKRRISAAFLRAAGLLKGKLKKTPLHYQRAARQEW